MLRQRANLIFSVCVVLVVAWMLWQARDWSFRARLFPWTIGWPALALALFQVGLATRGLRTPIAEVVEPQQVPSPDQDPGERGTTVMATAVEAAFGAGSPQAQEEQIPTDVARRRALEMCAWIMGFTIAIYLIGFKLGPALLTLAFLKGPARESWRMSIGVALGLYLSFLLVFEVGLNIRLPAGWIPDTLGYEAIDASLVDFLSGVLHGGGS